MDTFGLRVDTGNCRSCGKQYSRFHNSGGIVNPLCSDCEIKEVNNKEEKYFSEIRNGKTIEERVVAIEDILYHKLIK